MREIKFRGWHKADKQMHAVKTLDLDHWGVGLDKMKWVTHDDIELMQFTGLRDKNGKEIYEGDILTRKVGDWNGYPFEVKYGKGVYTEQECVYGWDFNGRHPSDLEVIGNIFENPELLKEVREEVRQ